jgi:hypothetical protein
MTRATRLFALLAAAALLAVAATPDLRAAPAPNDTNVSAQMPDIDPEIQTLLDRGDELGAEGNWGAARRHYQLAADLMKRQGLLPSKAMRRIANSHYYQDRYQSAGKILEQLAKEAAAYGELRCQAWALADAAWIAWIAGDKIDMDRRLVRLDRLLTSPYLPVEVRDEVVTKRLAGVASELRVAASPK